MERLRLAVQSAGGPGEVAKRAGVPLSTLGGYLAGGEMKLSSAMAIAEAAGVRLDWLALGIEPMSGSERVAGRDEGSGCALVLSPGTVLIDRHEARAAAGNTGALTDTGVIDRVVFSESWVRTVLRRKPQNLAILEAAGDSMEPTIRDGDVIMIDVAVEDLVSGRIYVVELAGELLVKRIQRRVNGNLLVLSDNSRYPPEEVPAEAGKRLRIIGEVVWRAHDV